MQPPVCRLCRQAHWSHAPHIWKGDPVAPVTPRSNAQSPSPSMRDKALPATPKSPQPTPEALEETHTSKPIASHGKPDTAPSVITPTPNLLAQMDDETFRKLYNAYQREYMRRYRNRSKPPQ